MYITSPLRPKSFVIQGVLLLLLGFCGVHAQGRRAPQPHPQSARAQQGQADQQTETAAQPSEPFIHGVTIAAGLAIYQGDFSRNPNHNIVKYVAGSGKLSLRAGVDHRLGRYHQFGVGADVVYNKLSGETTGGIGFETNSIALDFYADYELPYIKQGLFRVFVGGGPNFVISPSYTGFPEDPEDGKFDRLGTRVMGSLKVGVTILDKFRIGTRIPSSDLIDGYKGFDPDSATDYISFINFGYRFDL